MDPFFPKIGVPENGWFVVETPIKMHDLGVPLFLEMPIYSIFIKKYLTHKSISIHFRVLFKQKKGDQLSQILVPPGSRFGCRYFQVLKRTALRKRCSFGEAAKVWKGLRHFAGNLRTVQKRFVEFIR